MMKKMVLGLAVCLMVVNTLRVEGMNEALIQKVMLRNLQTLVLIQKECIQLLSAAILMQKDFTQ